MPTFRPEDSRDRITQEATRESGWPNGAGAAAPASNNVGSPPHNHPLFQQLLAAVPPDGAGTRSESDLRRELVRLTNELSEQNPVVLSYQEQVALIDQVVDELLGFGPVGHLLRDPTVSEILVNGPHQMFAERQGQLQAVDAAFRDEAHLLEVVRRMLVRSGRRLDRKSPMVDARLPDGSRLNAVLNPPALNGPLVSVRRFGVRPLTIDDLMAKATLTPQMLEFLSACVRARVSMLIVGGTGSGKTTLLNALSRFIPGHERLITIEDTAELELQQTHVAKMEAQPPDLSGEGGVTIRDLLRNALRMRPDRIIVGECRGGEVIEMLQAMNTGHEGSLTTVHANSCREAIARVELMVLLGGVDLPVLAIRRLVASSVNLIVHVARLPGGLRKVVSISEVSGMEGDIISMHELFTYVQTGVDERSSAVGHFQASGIRPNCLKKLAVRGEVLAPNLFAVRP
jgi:pilus assembly protein CpaF